MLQSTTNSQVVVDDIRTLDINTFQGQKFGVILADPPWAYDNSGPQGGVDKQYKCLTMDELFELPISDIAAKNSILLLWATFPQLKEAMDLVSAWGYKYITSLVWLKTDKNGSPKYGVGYWARGCAELILICRRGEVKPPRADGWLGIISPSFEHSRKPDTIYDYAESLPGPYLELFARRQRHGWACFGNEMQYALF